MFDISENKYFLPAIQRKFVWREDKICRLFNSIMQDYPIGTFLFWDLSIEQANKYTFYEFLKNYHERDSKNELVRYDFGREVRGVLDGQQRISSMFIALQGVYCTKKKYKKSSNDDAYPERMLYINLFSSDFEFKFLSEVEAISSEGKYYYLLRNVLSMPEDTDSDDVLEKLKNTSPDDALLLEKNKKVVKRNINRLIKKFNDNQLVSYFRIVDKELEDILDIFVRVNSGGTILSKSDLLFSTLVAHWEDGRERIEQLIDDMNGDDGLFRFNSDFLMRTCLFLVDAPMNFKVQTFDAKNISKIRDNWGHIRSALISAASMLREFGFNEKRLSSNYAVTPVAYYLYKDGVVDERTKCELKKLVVNSLLKQIFSGQADTALNGLRDGLRTKQSLGESTYRLKNIHFSFDEYQRTKLSGKKLSIDSEDIETFLEQKKGPFTFLLLSVLYPDLKLGQILFHQDHMHPYSKFNSSVLRERDSESIRQWQIMRDQLPNLQLLEGLENSKKQAVNLAKWVEDSEDDEMYYRKRNYIPAGQSLDFEEFEEFFNSRKEVLREELHRIFGVSSIQGSRDKAA